MAGVDSAEGCEDGPCPEFVALNDIKGTCSNPLGTEASASCPEFTALKHIEGACSNPLCMESNSSTPSPGGSDAEQDEQAFKTGACGPGRSILRSSLPPFDVQAARHVSFHDATVFNGKPLVTLQPKAPRPQSLLVYWVCGGATWVFFMGVWLGLGAWASLNGGRVLWALLLCMLAVHLCLYGLKGIIWSLKVLWRSTSNQASREKALQKWKDT